jgi:hypothetical protein
MKHNQTPGLMIGAWSADYEDSPPDWRIMKATVVIWKAFNSYFLNYYRIVCWDHVQYIWFLYSHKKTILFVQIHLLLNLCGLLSSKAVYGKQKYN